MQILPLASFSAGMGGQDPLRQTSQLLLHRVARQLAASARRAPDRGDAIRTRGPGGLGGPRRTEAGYVADRRGGRLSGEAGDLGTHSGQGPSPHASCCPLGPPDAPSGTKQPSSEFRYVSQTYGGRPPVIPHREPRGPMPRR